VLIKLPQELDSSMNLLLKVLIPVLILIGCVFAAKKVYESRPEPSTRPSFPTVQAVEAITLSKSQYPVILRSQGTVQPTQLTTLVSEVNGSITAISDVFVVGGEFSKGDVLLQLDERDYTIALTQAQASLAQASAQLQEEAARAELAKAEWQSLGRKANAFNLRLNATVGGVPQVWNGKVIRAEGVDASTQQLNIIARIDNPFVQGQAQLRIGQFVNAKISGRILDDVFVVPRSAVREDREVLSVNGQSQLERREVNIAWSDDETAAIKDDTLTGAVLVTTAMSTVTNGTPVRATVDGVEPPPRRRGAGGAGRPGAEGQPGAGGGQGGEGRRRGGQAGGEGRPAGQRRPDGERPAAGQRRGNGNGQGAQQGERRRPQGQNQPADANS